MKPELPPAQEKPLEQRFADLEKYARENGRIIPSGRRTVRNGHTRRGFVTPTHAARSLEKFEEIEAETDERNHPDD